MVTRRKPAPRPRPKPRRKPNPRARRSRTLPRPRRPARARPDRPRASAGMKRYLVAALLVWVPLGITLWVLHFLVTTLDQTLLLFPESARPDAFLGVHIPGFGVLLSFAILFLTGVIAANFFGA